MTRADVLAAAVRVADYGVLLRDIVRDRFRIPVVFIDDPDAMDAWLAQLSRLHFREAVEVARLWGRLSEQIAEAEYHLVRNAIDEWNAAHTPLTERLAEIEFDEDEEGRGDDDDDRRGVPPELEAAALVGAYAGAELADRKRDAKQARRVFRQLRGKRNLVMGQTVEEWLRATADSAIKRAKRIFRGRTQQVPADGKLTNVQAQNANQVTQAVQRANAVTERQVSGAARMTATKAVQVGQETAFDEGAKGVQFVAVLDERTTPMCQELSGMVWPVGSGDIQRPPIHYGCRSMLVPVYGDPQPKPFSYAQWIRHQPAAVQDRVLGKARGKMLRKGKGLHELIREGRYIRVRKPTAA